MTEYNTGKSIDINGISRAGLRQLSRLTGEIKLQRARLERMKNSMTGGSGAEQRSLSLALRKRQDERERLERFIDSIEDSTLRQIFLLRYAEGCTWRQTAQRMGDLSEDAARKRHDRFLCFLSSRS